MAGTGTGTVEVVDVTGNGTTVEVVDVTGTDITCKKPKPEQHGIGRACVVATLTLSLFPSRLSHWERSRERGREA